MKNKKIIIIIIAIAILLLGGLAVLLIKNNKKGSHKEPVKIVDSIDGYSYSLKENDSKLKKELYYELKKNLESETIDKEQYASEIAKLFVIDVFSLKNRVNKYDIGGLEYIYETETEKFKSLMTDTLYDTLQNNYDDDRDQDLPCVKSINQASVTQGEFSFDNKTLVSYDINLEWEYEKDLGYDKKATIKVVCENDIMYVVSYTPEN